MTAQVTSTSSLHRQISNDGRPSASSSGNVKHFERRSNKSRLKTRTCILLALCILLLIIAVILFTLLLFTLLLRKELCVTSHCIRTAHLILDSLDERQDPCQNFYQYACGGWLDKNPIPDDAPHVSSFENLTKQLEMAIKMLLSEKIKTADGTAVTKAKQYYDMCLDDVTIGKNWRLEFESILSKLGGWPSLTGRNWTKSIEYEYMNAILMKEYQTYSVVKITVQPDETNSSMHTLMLDAPALILYARDYYLLDEHQEQRQAYQDLIIEILGLLGVDSELATADTAEMINFEIAFANATSPEAERHDLMTMYRRTTLGDVYSKYKHFNFRRLFHHVFKDIPEVDTDRYLSDSAELVVYDMDFFDKLDNVLPQFSDRVLHNYILWAWFFRTILNDLPEPFAMAKFRFSRKLQSQQEPMKRWHTCVKQINSLMPMAISRIYVLEHFDNEAKHKVEEMIDLIMNELHDTFATEDWLTEATRKVAMEKASSIQQKIGFPDYLNNVSRVDEMYINYTVSSTNFFRTKFQFMHMLEREQLALLGTPVDRTRWASGAAVVNAFYSPSANEIIFPAGIFQPVFYDKNFPSAMNFGGIGVVIGHEIMHGFDDRGRLYDKHGNIRHWWDNETIQQFEEKARCIEDQYSTYLYEQVNMNINGARTKGENIADNGGLKHSFYAFQRWLDTHTGDDRHRHLPGVPFTPEQLFFINYAQIWCGKMNDQEAIRKLRTSEHCPGSIRVRGPLENFDEFSRVFQCPIGSAMNPTKKCEVW